MISRLCTSQESRVCALIETSSIENIPMQFKFLNVSGPYCSKEFPRSLFDHINSEFHCCKLAFGNGCN